MARRRVRVRARSRRNVKTGGRVSNQVGRIGALNGEVVPRVLVGAVDAVELIAVGALQLTRDVTMTAVSGVASIGAEALTATMSGARGIVSATSRLVGDVASAAQTTVRMTIDNARRSGRAAARSASRRPGLAAIPATESAAAGSAPRAKRRTRRLRLATHVSRPSEAA